MKDLNINDIIIVHGGQDSGSAPTVSTNGNTVTVDCPEGTEAVLMVTEFSASVGCAPSLSQD